MSDTGMVEKLSTWDKIKIGVKNFFKAALHYIPRGIITIGIVFGASALLEGATGWGLLGITKAFNEGHLLTKGLMSLAIGGVISGGVETYKTVSQAIKQNNAALDSQADELSRARSRGPERLRTINYEEPAVPTGIPNKAADMISHTLPHLLH